MKGANNFIDIYVFKRDYMGARWVFSESVSWEEYQRRANRIPNEGTDWKAKFNRQGY